MKLDTLRGCPTSWHVELYPGDQMILLLLQFRQNFSAHHQNLKYDSSRHILQRSGVFLIRNHVFGCSLCHWEFWWYLSFKGIINSMRQSSDSPDGIHIMSFYHNHPPELFWEIILNIVIIPVIFPHIHIIIILISSCPICNPEKLWWFMYNLWVMYCYVQEVHCQSIEYVHKRWQTHFVNLWLIFIDNVKKMPFSKMDW